MRRHLTELDVRGLYRDAGYSSLHVYCTDGLQMSDAESYARIHAARLSRRFPALLAHLRQGTLTLTTLQILGPKLEESNCTELLGAAAGLSMRDLEEMLAARFPKPDVPTLVRKLPTPRATLATEALPLLTDRSQAPPAPPTVTAPRPAARAVVAPLSAERFRVQLTSSREQRDKLNTARDVQGAQSNACRAHVRTPVHAAAQGSFVRRTYSILIRSRSVGPQAPHRLAHTPSDYGRQRGAWGSAPVWARGSGA